MITIKVTQQGLQFVSLQTVIQQFSKHRNLILKL